MFVFYNPNPQSARVGDCAVRALCKASSQDWDTTYLNMCIYGLLHADMPTSNAVWGEFLKNMGMKRHVVPETKCRYTVKEFLEDHPQGLFVLGLDGHVVCCVDGDYFDTWDSGDEVVVYYWKKGD